METRRIGSLEVSVVGMGCNNFGRRLDADATSDIVHAALDAGITFFDTADVYGDTKARSSSVARSGGVATTWCSPRSSAPR
jgi:aryl-alcohol dehydrogenase-like predicted oxidoreductase